MTENTLRRRAGNFRRYANFLIRTENKEKRDELKSQVTMETVVRTSKKATKVCIRPFVTRPFVLADYRRSQTHVDGRRKICESLFC